MYKTNTEKIKEFNNCNAIGFLLCYDDDFSEERNTKFFGLNSFDACMQEACHMACFSDCQNVHDLHVLAVCDNGYNYRIEYTGWQPDMLFTWKWQLTGEIAYEGYFPQWEH